MKKSFKRALAAILAVLMVITAFPMTAFAKLGDLSPDIRFQFGAVASLNNGDFTVFPDFQNCEGNTNDDFSYSGLCAPTLVYNEKDGSLTLPASRTAGYDTNGFAQLDADHTYGVGDFFTVTFTLSGISTLWASEMYINYSDNIEPAGVWRKPGAVKRADYAIGTQADFEKYGTSTGCTTEEQSPFLPFPGQNAVDLYNGDINVGATGDTSLITPEKRQIFITAVNQNGKNNPNVLGAVGPDGYPFSNPETGEAADTANYVYNDKMILSTFMFKITGEGPITFDLADKDNHMGGYQGCYVIVDDREGGDGDTCYTYAPNPKNPAGATKITFMGKNEHVTPEPPACEHTNLKYDYNGDNATNHTHKVTCADCQAVIAETEACTFTEEVTKPATCKVPGEKTYTCSKCGHTYTEEIPVVPHTPGEPQKENVQGATCTTPGSYDLVTRCTVCNEVLETVHKDGELAPHTPAAPVRENEKPATCTAKGSYEEVVYCADCHAEISRVTKEIPMAEHTPGEAVEENRVEPTCSTEGSYDLVTRCTVCNEVINTEHKTIAKLDHTPAAPVRENEKPATCQAAGSYDEVVYCSVCNAEISRETKEIAKLDHTPAPAVRENEVPATVDKPGSYDEVVYCSVCKEELSRVTKEIPMLEGYTVTVTEDGLGEVAGLNFGANRLAKNAEFTVTATALPGATFLGWYNGDKLLTTDATYTSVATSDVTLTPKFAEDGKDKITVTFLDMWGNTVKQFDSMTVADYQAAVAKEMPKATDVAGYQFAGWDMTDEEIMAIATSQTVRAKYTLKADGFTVTLTDGAKFVSGTTDGTNVKYDTLVEVKADGAKAWKIGSTIVGYGDTYSFYVGSDVTISPVFDAVETVKPETTIVKVTKTDSAVVNFLATRTVPEGFELVNAGFVFGKTADDKALVIENADKTVDGVKIHVGYCRVGGADQFLLPYGVKSMQGTIGARSFVTFKTADGEIQTIYSDVASYTY